MNIVIEAAKTLIEVLELEKSQNVLSMKSGRAIDDLEQAITQAQKPKILMVGADGHFKELSYEVVHDGNLLVHPSNFAQEQEIVRSCRNCKYSDCSSYVEPCFSCEGSTAEWEPKP